MYLSLRILKKSAKHFESINDSDTVERMLKEAIKLNEKELEARILLADHFLKTNNLDMCHQICTDLENSMTDPSLEVNLVKIKIIFKIFFLNC